VASYLERISGGIYQRHTDDLYKKTQGNKSRQHRRKKKLAARPKTNYEPSLIPRRLYKKRIAKIHTHLAESFIKKGNQAEGKKQLKQALSLYPLNAKAWKNYLLSFFCLKKQPER